MVVNDYGRPLKRVKRRVTADLYDFLKFPAGDDLAGESFRLRVSSFLSRHGRMTFHPELFSTIVAWQIFFRVGEQDSSAAAVVLDVVEEDVTRSRSVYCDQCRVVGWSGHPVCRKRYHFIIRDPETNTSGAGSRKSCSRCGNMLHLADSRCKWCNSMVTSDDLEDWVYSQFEDNSHLLHGVIHSNGFGHLLTLNGRAGGSKFLAGTDIMNFWDRLCRTLCVRKVSVMDVSKKYDMEYRLLHSITKGHSWYGDWGYEFSAGSYAVTLDVYKRAIDTLAGMPLSELMFQCRKPRTALQTMIAFYQSISEKELVTLRDLFSFMLDLIHGSQNQPAALGATSKQSAASNVLCAWTKDDIERVEQAAVKVLQAVSSDGRWVTWHALKGAMCKLASPELLDYCLKHLGGKITASDMVVQTRRGKTPGVVEFRVEPRYNEQCGTRSNANGPSKEQIVRDLKFLYDSLVHPDTMQNYRPQATRDRMRDSAAKLLDCKQFMRDYMSDERIDKNPFGIPLWCYVRLSDHPKDEPVIPPELVVLPLNASVADLLDEVTKTFQDVYVMFRRFQVEGLPEYGSIEKSISLKLLLGSSHSVHIQGKCPSKHGLNRFRMERGTESWTVDCVCGAKDDDGERMFACDTCGVWQHTRCAGIDSSAPVPSKFVCSKCKSSSKHKVVTKESETGTGSRSNSVSVSATSCKVEAMVADSKSSGTNLTLTYGVP